MSCENQEIPAPQLSQCVSNIFGIPFGNAGRGVGGTGFDITGVMIHCVDGTIQSLCAEQKCSNKSGIVSSSHHNSFHFGVGINGNINQFVHETDIAWGLGSYKANNYASPPPSAVALNWPFQQNLHGLQITGDAYLLHIAIARGTDVRGLNPAECLTECDTASSLPEYQHDQLVQLLAYLAQEHNLTIDSDHFTFADYVRCDSETLECPECIDLPLLLAQVAAYCPPCESEAVSIPIADPLDEILYLMGVTDSCCPESIGCQVMFPMTACVLGGLAEDGNLDSYILGLSQDPQTMQWCLTRGCLETLAPLSGCGTVDDPLKIDLCDWGTYIPVEPATNIVNVTGLDDQGCLIQAPLCDLVVSCETPITAIDSDCINLTVSGQSDHTLQADVIISTDDFNQLECRGNGLYVNITCLDIINEYPLGEIESLIGTNGINECVHEAAEDMLNRLICLITEDVAAEPTWLLGKTDAECPVFVTPDSIVAEGLEVVDTSTIDLTLVGNTLTADAIISPNADNVLVDDSGLYVPDITVSDGFCVHMNYDPVTRNINSEIIVAPHLPDNIFQCIPGAPGFSGAYVQDLTVVDSNCINLTYAGRSLTADIIVSPDADNVLTCNANGLYVQVGAGLTVVDTDCLDLTLVGGVLSGILTLAPTQGLIPNVLQCLPGEGLYVPQGAGLQVLDTNCIDLIISNGVLTADLTINPSGDNQVSCGPGGLFVPIAAGLIANDTNCVNHSLVGGVLSTTLNIAGPQGGVPNILACIAGQGLYVPETHITVVDTTCIDLDFTSGVLRADIIIDPTGDNQVQCLPAGLYVPPTAGLVANDTDCITLNLAGDTLTSTPILAPAQAGCQNALTCLPSGLYVPELVFDDTDCIALDLTGCVVTATPIIDPDVCNALECRDDGLFVEVDIRADTTTVGIGINNVGPTLPPVYTETEPPTFVIMTNPSSCHSITYSIDVSGMQVNAFNQLGVASTLVDFEMQYTFDGGGTWFQGSNLQTGISLAPSEFKEVNTTSIAQSWTVGPGASFTFGIRRLIRNVDGNFNGQVVIDANFVNISGVATP